MAKHDVTYPCFADHMAGLKKAGKAVTKQLGKTLTSLGESPDKRGLQMVQQARDTGSVVTRGAHSVGVSSPLGLDTGMSPFAHAWLPVTIYSPPYIR